MIIVAAALGLFFFIFWTAEIFYVHQRVRWTKNFTQGEECEGVTVIKPIKDVDFQLEENLESWLNQDYKGPMQYIFSFQDEKDPAILLVEKLKKKHPEKDIMITVNPITPRLNGKSSNMKNGVERAKYEVLVFGDSDTRVLPNFITKMVDLLKKPKAGVVSCAQMNQGGKDFWTRFFTYIQNCETVFHWSFLSRIGMKVGANGAALAIRKSVLEELGGVESFGSSLLEDMLLGNLLTDKGYKVIVGPFIDCPVDRIPRDKVLNYIRRSTIGFRTLIKAELPLFIFMLFWYWLLFIIAVVTFNIALMYLSFLFMIMRIITGMIQRWITERRVLPIDLILPVFFDVFGTYYLFYSFRNSRVVWRGIEYEIQKNGNIRIVQ